LGRAPKNSDESRRHGEEGCRKALPRTVLSLSPLAPCGRGAGGERVAAFRQRAEVRTKTGRLLWGPRKKSPHQCVEALLYALPRARRARYFAMQSTAQKSFVATSFRLTGCNKLGKFSVGIRAHLAILGLGRNSGTSGDFQPTRPTQRSRKFFPERISKLRAPTVSVEATGVGDSFA